MIFISTAVLIFILLNLKCIHLRAQAEISATGGQFRFNAFLFPRGISEKLIKLKNFLCSSTAQRGNGLGCTGRTEGANLPELKSTIRPILPHIGIFFFSPE